MNFYKRNGKRSSDRPSIRGPRYALGEYEEAHIREFRNLTSYSREKQGGFDEVNLSIPSGFQNTINSDVYANMYIEKELSEINRVNDNYPVSLCAKVWVGVWWSVRRVFNCNLNAGVPVVAFFQRLASSTENLLCYKRLFGEFKVPVYVFRSLSGFRRFVDTETMTLAHVFSGVKDNVFGTSRVRAAAYEFDGSKGVAQRTSFVVGLVFGYDDGFYDRGLSQKYFESFYRHLLKGFSVGAALTLSASYNSNGYTPKFFLKPGDGVEEWKPFSALGNSD